MRALDDRQPSVPLLKISDAEEESKIDEEGVAPPREDLPRSPIPDEGGSS